MSKVRYVAKELNKIDNGPDVWQSLLAGVFALRDGEETQVGIYTRNSPSLQRSFHHFQQRGQDYALYAPRYNHIRVMELPSCIQVAAEEEPPAHFCPVDFLVPWSDDPEVSPQLQGEFGFVSGVYWGDPMGERIEYLDLSDLRQGTIRRDRRFGIISAPLSCDLA
jgi:hypothetical protein